MIEYAVVIIVSYLVGSIPSGLILGRIRGIDVREYGSGNIGTTNVLRTLGKKFGAIVMAADLLKGVVAVLLARYVIGAPAGEMAAALAVVAGHDWSLYLRFRGGRGVATSAGALIVMAPLVAAAGIVTFVAVVALTRYVSLGSIAAAAGTVIVMAVFTALDRAPFEYLIFIGIAVALIVFQHRENVARLLAGTENKLGQKAEKRQTT